MGTERLNEEQKRFLSEQRIWMVATASSEGKPNVAAKGSTKVIDDVTLAFGQISKDAITYKNIQDNPWVTIAVVDPSKRAAVRCYGKAEICSSGDLYDGIAAMLSSKGHPKPEAVIRVKISNIRSMP